MTDIEAPGYFRELKCNLMLEHILQNNDHILDIDLVVTVNIAVSGVLPVAVAGLRLIPALAGGIRMQYSGPQQTAW